MCIIDATGYENHPNDSRVTESGDISQTLSTRMGTGGGNCPIVIVRKYVSESHRNRYGRGKEFFPHNGGCHTDFMHYPRRGACNTCLKERWKIEKLWCGDGDKLKPRSNYNGRKGGNGFGISEDEVCYTETVVDRHMVFYIKRKIKS